jgi:hypothetical protein
MAPKKQAGIAVLISDKVDFEPKLVRRDKEGHCILIKGTTHREEMRIINSYVSNVGVSNFIKHTLLNLKHR